MDMNVIIKTENDIEFDELIGYPEVKQIYKPPERQCLMKQDLHNIYSHFTNVLIITFISITIAIIIVFVLLYFRRRNNRYHNRLV